jgi:hypothetical protein
VHFHHHSPTHTLSRRGVICATAGALGGAALATILTPSAIAEEGDAGAGLLPPPKPILGGDVIPPQIHAWEPGEPAGKTLPFTGAPFDGLNVEPATITDFHGFTAQAYPVGTATGSDGKRYNLEGDIRVMDGSYVAETGARREGSFALI